MCVNPSLGPEHFETVLDAVPEAVLTMDRNFVITSFNRAAERLTGFRRTEVVGQHCYEVCRSPGCRTATDCPMTITLRNGTAAPAPREIYVLNRRNEQMSVRIVFTILRDLDGQIAGGVEAFHALQYSEAAPSQPPHLKLPILEASERRAIEDVLRRHNWNRTLAAQELNISRITLWRKMRKLSISPRP